MSPGPASSEPARYPAPHDTTYGRCGPSPAGTLLGMHWPLAPRQMWQGRAKSRGRCDKPVPVEMRVVRGSRACDLTDGRRRARWRLQATARTSEPQRRRRPESMGRRRGPVRKARGDEARLRISTETVNIPTISTSMPTELPPAQLLPTVSSTHAKHVDSDQSAHALVRVAPRNDWQAGQGRAGQWLWP